MITTFKQLKTYNMYNGTALSDMFKIMFRSTISSTFLF